MTKSPAARGRAAEWRGSRDCGVGVGLYGEPHAHAMDVDMLLDEGIDLFNRRYFFEAHDVWEEIWQKERGGARDFFKGLIHLAGGFHHYTNGNYIGSAALLASGMGYLRPHVPERMGLDVAAILSEVEAQHARIVRLRDGRTETEDVQFPTIVRRR